MYLGICRYLISVYIHIGIYISRAVKQALHVRLNLFANIHLSDPNYIFYLLLDGIKELALLRYPISITLGLFDDIFLVDASQREEAIIRGSFTCITESDNTVCLVDQV